MRALHGQPHGLDPTRARRPISLHLSLVLGELTGFEIDGKARLLRGPPAVVHLEQRGRRRIDQLQDRLIVRIDIRIDLSLHKQFNLTEKRYFELRAESFNLFNTPIFQSPASQTITSSLFGQIRSSQGERNIELAAKFYF